MKEYKLRLKEIDEDALYVVKRLEEAGFVAYLVGGSVRDLLLGHKPKDYDISTSAKPEEIKRLFRNSILIGRRFRLAHIRFGHKVFEVSTFRSGTNEADTLIVRDNEWGTPEEDALRRDFTINGLFYDPGTETVIDYIGGYPDIQKKYLRTIGQPFLRFKQDPVRMIRMLKFQARFGFEVDADTRLALLDCRGEIVKSSQARIFEELLRMLESGASESFFRLMTDHGILELMLPALGAFLESRDGDEIFSFLREIDTSFHEPGQPPLERAILLSCLIFPYFQKHLQTHFLDRDRIPHLGEIHQEALKAVDHVFRPFFILPRRFRVGMVSILTTQFRLSPLEKKKPLRMRIPNDAEFPLSLKFLEIRSTLEPGLQKTFEEWSIHFASPHRLPTKPRRRRRRPHGKP